MAFYRKEKNLKSGSESCTHSGSSSFFLYGIFSILVVRTANRFYKQSIGQLLLFATVSDVVLALSIVKTGLFGFAILPTVVSGSSVLYFLLCNFLISHCVKVKVEGTAHQTRSG